MAARRKHRDVEFAVSGIEASMFGVGRLGKTQIFSTYEEAAIRVMAFILRGQDVVFDVLVYSEAGARFVGGDDGVEQYREDPDASVFERYEIRGNHLGRVR